jgi:transcriptional regulator with XRE-family HTH domain
VQENHPMTDQPTQDIYKVIRNAIKDAFRNNDITQLELSELVGIRQNTLSMFINKRERGLSYKNLKALCDYFSIDPRTGKKTYEYGSLPESDQDVIADVEPPERQKDHPVFTEMPIIRKLKLSQAEANFVLARREENQGNPLAFFQAALDELEAGLPFMRDNPELLRAYQACGQILGTYITMLQDLQKHK